MDLKYMLGERGHIQNPKNGLTPLVGSVWTVPIRGGLGWGRLTAGGPGEYRGVMRMF